MGRGKEIIGTIQEINEGLGDILAADIERFINFIHKIINKIDKPTPEKELKLLDKILKGKELDDFQKRIFDELRQDLLEEISVKD